MPDLRAARRFAVYAGVGAMGTAAQYAVLIAMVRTGWASPALSSMAGASVGAIVNYGLNRRITFRSNSNPLSTAPKFAIIALLGVLTNGVCMKFFVNSLGLNYLIAQLVTTALVLGLTYLLNSMWTFNEQERGSAAASGASIATQGTKVPSSGDASPS
ncbi:GtrA family protein [Paraburkholderia lycopersici]|uniref:Putative flippase GtrA (Transmembrane translocase of bactoprenol-linked glucose) n=1 Tax=Paraburkholderia lycopersici TaxID=416944 RepID=A0A1G6GJP9_9BURK|nr:GtrA family protein [Paraburkholderia lycopersici]SDB82227.1 Putative flippase GtrA (transmembrane translocase of bactoprenol-linked glucose) [Paraburkholderia lycopersici]